MEMVLNGKADAWRQRVESQRISGQSVRAWCAANGVAEHSFYFWRKRVNGTGGAGLSPAAEGSASPPQGRVSLALARVKIVEEPAVEAIRLRLARGRELVLPVSMGPAKLAELIAALEERS